jgi:hypothetical protein
MFFVRNEMRNDLRQVTYASRPLEAYSQDVEEQVRQIYDDLAPLKPEK